MQLFIEQFDVTEGYEIGPILREIRKDKRLTVEDVADSAGISVSTLSQLEQGQSGK